MSKLRGAVIGFGNIGQKLTRFINEERDDAEIVAVCNRGTERLAIARDEFGLDVSHDPADVICRDDVDFVIIASVNAAHKDQVMTAARAEKHIFCEKPIALSYADAMEMVEAVESRGLITCVNYSLRYIPAYIKLKELADAGTFGDILSLWIIRTRGYGLYVGGARHKAVTKFAEAGGWTIHHACHGIDYLYWLGGRIKRVFGNTHSTAPEGEEMCWGMLEFQSGAGGMVGDSVSTLREHHTGIIGTKGSAVLTGLGKEAVLKIKAEGTDQEDEPEVIPVVDRKTKGGGMGHFLDCIKEGKPSPASLREASHSIAVACAIQQSARTGEAVEVPA